MTVLAAAHVVHLAADCAGQAWLPLLWLPDTASIISN